MTSSHTVVSVTCGDFGYIYIHNLYFNLNISDTKAKRELLLFNYSMHLIVVFPPLHHPVPLQHKGRHPGRGVQGHRLVAVVVVLLELGGWRGSNWVHLQRAVDGGVSDGGETVVMSTTSPRRSRARMGWSEDWSLVVGVLEPALHQSGRGSGIM